MQTGLNASTGGLQRALQEHAARAERIARMDRHGDPAKDLAEQPADAARVKANAQAIRTGDEMLGGLLDLLA